MNINIKTWERDFDESEEAFRAFKEYRDLGQGNRSLRQVCLTLYGAKNDGDDGNALNPKSKKNKRQPKNLGKLGQWSSKHKWVSRVRAYDWWLDSVELRTREEEVKKMAQRQAQQAHVNAAALSIMPAALIKKREQIARVLEESPVTMELLEMITKLTAIGAKEMPKLHEAEQRARGISLNEAKKKSADSIPTAFEDADEWEDELDEFMGIEE